MKTSVLIIALTIAAIGFYCGTSNAPLKGKVSDSVTGSPVASATITVMQGKTYTACVKSGTDGIFSVVSLKEGNYSIKVECSGYITEIKNNVLIKTGQTTLIEIKLNPVGLGIKNTKEERKKDEKAVYDMMIGKVACESMAYAKCASISNQGAGAAYTASYDVQEADFNTESYDKINENTFKDALGNPLSTFSIDVDRASYSNIRRFLSQNQKPYKDAVRIEEMINYFDYNYPQPKNGEPFSSTMEIGKCPWNDKHDILLIGLQGENISEEKIPPSNLVFLVDVSGSMSDQNKLPLLKQAFKILVNNLRSIDKVAIVVYAGAAGLVLESTPGNEKAKINASLDLLQSGGCTAGGAGIQLAYKIAKENFIKGGNNRVILATDGDFNIGSSSDGEMVRLIEEKRESGVFLTILGFGMGNYKDSKMQKIADAGNGNNYYIDNILEAKKVFGKELWGTLYTIAKDVKIQVEFNPAKVKAYRLIGYEKRILNKEDFNDDKKDAGEIGCGHTVTALYEIISANSDEKISNVDPLEYQNAKVVDSKNLLTLKIRYKKPDEDTSLLIVHKLKDGESYSSKLSENLKFAASVAEFGMLLRESEFKGNSSYEQALALAREAKGKDADGFRSDFIKMVETAELLTK